MPPTEQFANNASSTLFGAIDGVTTSLVVFSATSFPSSPQFRIEVETEIMLVTAVASDLFTVVRGAEGTVAQAHSDGVPVTHIVTAGALGQLKADAEAGPVYETTTTDGNAHPIVSYTPPAHSSHRIALTIVGRNRANVGDEYSADFVFHLSTDAASITPSSPIAISPVTLGAGSSFAVSFSFTGGVLTVSVQGVVATTVDWAAILHDAVRQ